VPDLGSGSRRSESSHPDQNFKKGENMKTILRVYYEHIDGRRHSEFFEMKGTPVKIISTDFKTEEEVEKIRKDGDNYP
jgi:hypothetical protein